MSRLKFKPETQLASRADLAVAYVTDIARSVGRIALKHRHRNGALVDAEYNSDTWAKVLEKRAWLAVPTLEQFLIGEDGGSILAKIDGRIARLSLSDYYCYRLDALSELIGRHVGSTNSLLELGAGYGYNLFSLGLQSRWQRLRGLDISANGIEAGRQIASHFQLSDRVSFGQIDLTDPDDPHFGEVEGATVFTYFCLEQIPHLVKSVVENILRARPARVVNIEPSVHMLRLTRPRDFASRIYIESMDYQTRLFHFLDDLDKQGRIRILARERMEFAPTLHNDGLLYAWEPRF